MPEGEGRRCPITRLNHVLLCHSERNWRLIHSQKPTHPRFNLFFNFSVVLTPPAPSTSLHYEFLVFALLGWCTLESVIKGRLSTIKVTLEWPPRLMFGKGSRWCSGNTIASHLWGRKFKPQNLSVIVGSCLPMVYSTEPWPTNCMYCFPLSAKLPIMIWPVQCWKQGKTPNK